MQKLDLDVLLGKNPQVDKDAARGFAQKRQDAGPTPAKKGPELPTPYGGKRMMVDERSMWAGAPAVRQRPR